VSPRQDKADHLGKRSARTDTGRPIAEAGLPAALTVDAMPDSEIELKFSADEATFKAAQASPLFGTVTVRLGWRLLRTTYFDTPTGRLQRKKTALRLRTSRSGNVMALKWDRGEGGLARGEVEVTMRSAELDIGQFEEATSERLREMIRGESLVPVFTTEVRRAVRLVECQGALIEVAFDRGSIVAGELREPIREIELELKSGSSVGLFHLALELALSLPVQLDVRTKAKRGARLLVPSSWESVLAARLVFGPDTSTDEGIRQIIVGCMVQFIGNWPGSLEGRSEGCVHQMRVSLRRFRAALAIFNHTFPCDDFKALRADAKRLASSMGDARDWDVFIGHMRSGPLAEFPEDLSLANLIDVAEARAVAGHKAVRLLLTDPETTRFVLRALDVAARRTWRSGLDAQTLPLLVGPVSSFAAQNLERLDKKARKRGRRFGSLPPGDLHELRILLKNVRYAADFFGHVFDAAGDIRRYARRVSELQDLLGLRNDIDVASRLVRSLPLEKDRDLSFAAGLVMGWHGHAAQAGRETLFDAWKSFLKADRYWRPSLPERESELSLTSEQGKTG
jgi:triphosphatase